jgi:hypothetical protein
MIHLLTPGVIPQSDYLTVNCHHPSSGYAIAVLEMYRLLVENLSRSSSTFGNGFHEVVHHPLSGIYPQGNL